MNEMSDSSTRIKSILGRFDDIDQETLVEMMQLAGDAEDMGNTPSLMLDDAKNTVYQIVAEIKELSDSQASLLDNLKLWFKGLTDTTSFLNNEAKGNSETFDAQSVFDVLANYISETETKMEKAQILHNDVSQFWMQQVGKYRRSILQKNGEITHLKESIEAAANARARRKEKVKNEQKNTVQNAELMSKIQSQIRTIEEQKNSIDGLKTQLQGAQAQLAFFQANQNPASENMKLKMTERDNEMNQSKYESEAKIEMLQQRIYQLEKQSQRLQNDLNDEREKFQLSITQLKNTKSHIGELEKTVQKYIKLLELEKSNKLLPGMTTVDTSKDELLEERMLEIAKCKEEMRELNLRHKEELYAQADKMRSKYAAEKQKLISSMESKDSNSLLNSIIAEYEKKLDDQKKAYDDLGTSLIRQWGGKLSLLTRQYETRLKNQQIANEVSILKKNEEIQFEVKKEKLEIEDEMNKKILGISQDFANKMAKLERNVSRLQSKNDSMKEEINNYKDLLNIKKVDDENDGKSGKSKIKLEEDDEEELNAINPVENFVDRIKIIKVELDEQKQWEMKMQKDLYENKLANITESHQQEMRTLLMRIQDSLSRVNSEGENSITVADALSKVHSAFVTLNVQCGAGYGDEEEEEKKDEKEKDDNEERISLKEASTRMTFLKDKVIRLTSENNELRKGSSVSNFANNFETENDQLRMKVKYLESLQQGNNDEAIKNLQKIEESLRMEIEVRDALIEQLKQHISPCNFDFALIFEKEPKNENSLHSFVNAPLVKADLLIRFTEGSIEIPQEYFEYDEDEDEKTVNKVASEPKKLLIVDNNNHNIDIHNEEPSENPKTEEIKPQAEQVKPKPAVKTKVKTIIREVPKIEYVYTPKIMVQKRLSSLAVFEIFERNIKLSLRNGHALTLDTPPPGANTMTKIIGERLVDSDASLLKDSSEDFIQMADMKPPMILSQPHFLMPNPFTQMKEREEYQKSADNLISDSKLINNQHSDSTSNAPKKLCLPPQNTPKTRILNKKEPAPPPNSPIKTQPIFERVDAETLTDPELLPPSQTIEKIVEKNVEKPKASIFMSTPFLMVNIPMRIQPTSNIVGRIVKRKGSYVIAEYSIANFEPKPPPPIVITADENTKMKIDELQNQIKNMSKNKDASKCHSDMLKQVPEMTVFFRDRTIAFKEHQIQSLRAIIDSMEDQQRRERERRLAEIKKKNREIYSIPQNLTGPLLAENSSANKLDQLHDPSKMPKIPESQSTKSVNDATRKEIYNSNRNGQSSDDTSNGAKAENINELLKSEDPLNEAIQITSENLRFVAGNIETFNRITSSFNSDVNTFESLLRATKAFDENNQRFISDLKESEKLIYDNTSQLNTLQIRQNQVLVLLQKMKKEENTRKNELSASEKLKMQQKIIEEIQLKSEKTENSVDQLLVLQQIQAAVNVVSNLDILDDSDEDCKLLRSISFKVNEFQNRLKAKKPVPHSDIDAVVMQMQSFLAGIKPRANIQAEVEEKNMQEENEKLRTQQRKYRKKQHSLEKEVRSFKDRETNFEAQISQLQNRLCEQKELAENSSSMYFAQMDSIKSIMNQISNGDSSSTDFVNNIKKEVLNLQIIADTAVHEKEVYRNKANEAEDRILQADVEKANTIRELNELQSKYEKLGDNLKKASEAKLFFDSDLRKLKTEKAIEIEAKMILNEQIQKLIDESSKSNSKLSAKSEKLRKIKNEFDRLKMENDELTIRLTFGHYNRAMIPKTGVATQTMFHRKRKTEEPKKENSTSEPTENENKAEEQPQEIHNEEEDESKSIPNEQNENEAIDQPDQFQEEDKEEIFDNIDLSEMHKKYKPGNFNQNSLMSLSASSNSIFSSQVQWEEEIDPDNYNGELTEALKTDRPDNILAIGDKAVETVHQPLSWKKKPVQTTFITPKSVKQRPTTVARASRTQTNPDDLSIGNIQPGKRQLTGATQTPKPLLSQKASHNAYGNNTPMLEPLESALTTVSINRYPSTEPTSPKGKRLIPSTPTLNQTRQLNNQNLSSQQSQYMLEKDKNLNDTVRITRYDVEAPTPSNVPKNPIVTPKVQTKRIPNATVQQNMPNMAEVHRVLCRLREKSLKTQEKLEKKTKIIDDLKRKLSEITRENQQQRLSILRAEDEAKRVVLRFDSLKIRYEIIFKELSVKDEELSDVKRELAELRKISAPAASSLSRLKNAQIEQLRIQHEKERQKDVITVAKSALSLSTNAEAQKHLNTLMVNTQRSIARLEAKRQFWKDIEKKQVMGALGALSLIDDKKSLITLKKTISPFRSRRTKKKSLFDFPDDTEYIVKLPESGNNVQNSTSFNNITFAKQLENIDRIKPELNENEKKQIIHGNVKPDLAYRIVEAEKLREEQERINNVVITPIKK